MVILAERSKITCRATHGPLLRCVTLSPHSSTTPLTKIVTELFPSYFWQPIDFQELLRLVEGE